MAMNRRCNVRAFKEGKGEVESPFEVRDVWSGGD